MNSESLKKGTEIYQFFNMSGLAINARIGPGVVHSFFASQFAHNTAMAVGVGPDDSVFMKHPTFTTFAWGASGRPVYTRTRARRWAHQPFQELLIADNLPEEEIWDQTQEDHNPLGTQPNYDSEDSRSSVDNELAQRGRID